MSLVNDLATKRSTQIKAVVGAILVVLYFAFAVTQFVEVDNAQRYPRYTAMFSMPDREGQYTEAFPHFSLCPLEGTGLRSGLCTYVSEEGNTIEVNDMEETSREIFIPQLGGHETFPCINVRPADDVIASTHHDYIQCNFDSEYAALIQFFTDDPPENADNIFMWSKLEIHDYYNFGLYPIERADKKGNLMGTIWNAATNHQSNYTAGNELSFSIQFLSAETLELREFNYYSFWEMMGVVGGAALVFYAMYRIILFGISQMPGVKESDPEYPYDDLDADNGNNGNKASPPS